MLCNYSYIDMYEYMANRVASHPISLYSPQCRSGQVLKSLRKYLQGLVIEDFQYLHLPVDV